LNFRRPYFFAINLQQKRRKKCKSHYQKKTSSQGLGNFSQTNILYSRTHNRKRHTRPEAGISKKYCATNSGSILRHGVYAEKVTFYLKSRLFKAEMVQLLKSHLFSVRTSIRIWAQALWNFFQSGQESKKPFPPSHVLTFKHPRNQSWIRLV
jgi:hypothetical protein